MLSHMMRRAVLSTWILKVRIMCDMHSYARGILPRVRNEAVGRSPRPKCTTPPSGI